LQGFVKRVEEDNVVVEKGSVDFLYLSQEDVIAAGGLEMRRTIETVEMAFRANAKGETINPPKTVIMWDKDKPVDIRRRVIAMPSCIESERKFAGIKWISSVPENPKRLGIPRATALIILNDYESGMPLCVMNGTIVSAMRTGAISGVAAKYLAKRDSQTVGLIGTGVQGRTQLMALKIALTHLKRIQVYDLDSEKAEGFAREMEPALSVSVQVVESPEAVFQKGDVVITATVSDHSYIKRTWPREGCLYIEISGFDSEMDVLKAFQKVVVDDWEQVKDNQHNLVGRSYGAGFFTDKDLYASLPEIVIGRKPGREKDEEKVFFNPLGMSICDLFEAYRVYQSAREKGIGNILSLWEKPIWV
jgi:2,3-diaminopropionate biosynthesis protein SbnB